MATLLAPVADSLPSDVQNSTSQLETEKEATEQESCLVIPIRDEDGNEGDKAISIRLSELPNAEIILGILKAERADLRIWLDFGVEYYRQHKNTDFEKIMQVGTGEEVEAYYSDDVLGRVALLNCYAAYCIEMGKRSMKDNKEREREKRNNTYFNKATRFLNRAISLDTKKTFDHVRVTQGLFDLARNESDAALRKFESALQINSSNLLATLGLAKIYYYKTNYKKSLDRKSVV